MLCLHLANEAIYRADISHNNKMEPLGALIPPISRLIVPQLNLKTLPI